MSTNIGFNSDLKIARKKFHLQSSYVPDAHSINVSIFDGGRMVYKDEFILEKNLPEHELHAQVSYYHEIVQADIELVFSIVDKVRAKKLAAPIISLAILFYERGFYQEAIEQFKYAQKMEPHNFFAHFEFGKAYFANGNFKEALEQFEYAVTSCATFADVYFYLAQTHWRLENFAAAMHAFRRAFELNEKYNDAYYAFAFNLVESIQRVPVHPELPPTIERLKDAENALNKMICFQPKNYNENDLAAALEIVSETNKTDKTLEYLEKAKTYIPQGKSRILEREFFIKFMYGELDTDEASLDYYIHKIQKLLTENPDYPDLHHILGIAYLIKGWQCFGKSTEEFRKAVDINTKYEKALKKLKLMQNDGRGLLILLRAVLG